MTLQVRTPEAVAALAQPGGAPEEPAQGGTPRVAADAPIAQIAGSRLPKYSFAAGAPGGVPRIGKAGGSEKAAGDSAVPIAAAAVPPLGAAAEPRLGWDAAAEGRLLRGPQDPAAPGRSLLDGLLLSYWEAASSKGLFRYDVTACPTRVLPGNLGFVAQLNVGRATKKRPTEFKLDEVCQPFDPSKFNFNKAAISEALFAFEPAAAGAPTSAFTPSGRLGPSPNLVLVNVSPIDYGHVLLCPRVLDCLPQLLDRQSVLLALRYAREAANPHLRVGYNSLGAYATINHLHFQSYYLNTPMPIERTGSAPLTGLGPLPTGVTVSRLSGYPVRAFVITSDGASEGALGGLADVVTAAALALQEANVPHNMLISDCGTRVFLTPQCYAEKQAKGLVPEHLLNMGVNPAVWEITGHMVLFREDDYEALTQDQAWELLAAISLTEERFLEVARICFGGAPAATAADAAVEAVEAREGAAAAAEVEAVRA